MKWNKILSAAAVAALALSLVACGGDTSADAPVEEAASSEAVVSEADSEMASEAQSMVESEATDAAAQGPLASVEAYELTDLANTGWQLSGGMGDGAELDEAGMAALAEQCGGVSGLVFLDDSNVQYITEAGEQDGIYAITNNVALIQFENDDTTYACFLTVASDESATLVMLTDDTYSNALYFTQIDEG